MFTSTIQSITASIVFTFFITTTCLAGEVITAKEAASHIGENVTVCGVVASARYASSTKGQPTFLNLDEPYPRQIFTALIWGSDRPAFGMPEKTFAGKKICVKGKVKSYRGVPEIVVKVPSQIYVGD